MIQLQNLRYIVLSGGNPNPDFKKEYDSAFHTWKSVWVEAYKELGIEKQVFSDDFTRQTEINCLFYGEECIAMLFLTLADLSLSKYSEDSYFRNWSSTDIATLTKDGSQILICSNTTLHKDWRRSSCGISVKDLIMHMVARRFLFSQASAMTGFVRKARGIHELVYRFGATPLRVDVQNFNETDIVDIVAFFKGTTTLGTDELVREVGETLWKSRTIVPGYLNVVKTRLPEEAVAA